MGEALTFIILILLATIEARFPYLLFPSVFLTFYMLWIMKSNTSVSRILFISFITGITIDAINISHIWLYPFLMPLLAACIVEMKQRVNLALIPIRITVFTISVFILFLPLYFYYGIPLENFFLRSLFTAIVIEGVLFLLWKSELN